MFLGGVSCLCNTYSLPLLRLYLPLAASLRTVNDKIIINIWNREVPDWAKALESFSLNMSYFRISYCCSVMIRFSCFKQSNISDDTCNRKAKHFYYIF